MKGRVKWWSTEKGYGFIEFNDNKDIFAHIEKKEKKQLKENQEIEFEIEKKDSGQFIKLLSPIKN